MIPTNYHWLFALFSALVCIYCAFRCYWCEKASQDCVQWVGQANKRSVTLKQLADIQTELTELSDALAAYGESLKKLRSRVGMRKLRDERAVNGSEIPDPASDPAAWKTYMRQKIHMKQIGEK